jgi:glucose-1-phosphate adenylyltransferase
VALPRALVLVLAGGAGSRLELLTERRAKAAVPFAGSYRLIDFPLSNCMHSSLPDVWVSVQFNPASIAGHLANGRPWDLDRTDGGLMTLPPHRGTEREGWDTGTADALWRNADLVRQHDPQALVVLSADAVYRLDYREVLEGHLASGAEVTMVTTQVEAEDASRYGVVQAGGDGAVREYAYKPEDPRGTTVATEVFVLDPGPTLERLEGYASEPEVGHLGDLGDRLLPDQARDGGARAHPLGGYWRDVGTLEAYWAAHRDLLDPEPPIDLDDPEWPVRSRGGLHGAARVERGAQVEQSLLSGGASVAGLVRGSVLSPGVVVEAGAEVVDSVLLPGARVCAGARVARSIVDDGVVVGERARVGALDDPEGGLALVGREARLEPGAVVEAGGRWPEPEQGR